MQLPNMLKIRVMTKIMPEEILLAGAIEELTRYKEALNKYNEASGTENSAENKQSLKDKLFGTKKESSEKPSNNEAISRTMAILVKWIDEERSMEEIIASSHTLEEIMDKIN